MALLDIPGYLTCLPWRNLENWAGYFTPLLLFMISHIV
jgi:hypothetical protein